MNPKPFKRHAALWLLLCLGVLMPTAAWAKPKDRKPVAVASDYVQAARTALEQNNPMAARTAVEQYFLLASDTAAERAEMATTLKWALLTGGRLNEDFLAYSAIPEMSLMLPIAFPANDRIAKPYSCLTMACGLYVPAMSTMICTTDRNDLDPFSARLLTEICLKTGRLSLARRYISHLPKAEQSDWYNKLAQGRQALWAWDSLPYHLTSEPRTTDAWVERFYPLDSTEKAAFDLNPTQARCLLDYYTLLQLLFKRFDRLPNIAEAYRDLGASRLPTYVQEALLLSMNYLNGGISKNELLQWRSGDLRIEPDIIARFEQWFFDFSQWRDGADNWMNIQKKHSASYIFYFIWDGIAF